MDIKETIKLKKALEVKICDLCGEFSNNTGLEIKEIYFRCDTIRDYYNNDEVIHNQYRVNVDAGI